MVKKKFKINKRIFEVDIDENITEEDEMLNDAHNKIAEQIARNNELISVIFFEELEQIDE